MQSSSRESDHPPKKMKTPQKGGKWKWSSKVTQRLWSRVTQILMRDVIFPLALYHERTQGLEWEWFGRLEMGWTARRCVWPSLRTTNLKAEVTQGINKQKVGLSKCCATQIVSIFTHAIAKPFLWRFNSLVLNLQACIFIAAFTQSSGHVTAVWSVESLGCSLEERLVFRSESLHLFDKQESKSLLPLAGW